MGRAHGAVQLPARRVRRRNAAAREPIPAGSQVIRNWHRKFLQCLDLISTKAHHGTHSSKLTRSLPTCIGRRGSLAVIATRMTDSTFPASRLFVHKGCRHALILTKSFLENLVVVLARLIGLIQLNALLTRFCHSIQGHVSCKADIASFTKFSSQRCGRRSNQRTTTATDCSTVTLSGRHERNW